MHIKGLEALISNRKVSIQFPDKKSIIIKGSNTKEVIRIIEALLGQDMTDYYTTKDKEYGYEYKAIGGDAQLVYTDGIIYSKNQVVGTKGKIPKTHVIRYLHRGKFRSFITEEDTVKSTIYTDMTKYSNVLPKQSWFRLIKMVNNYLGFDYIQLENDKLSFNYQSDSEFSETAVKFVYMITSECFLTPTYANRVVLLNDIDILTKAQKIKLIEMLDNIKGHSLLISDTLVNYSDLSSNSCVSVINI